MKLHWTTDGFAATSFGVYRVDLADDQMVAGWLPPETQDWQVLSYENSLGEAKATCSVHAGLDPLDRMKATLSGQMPNPRRN